MAISSVHTYRCTERAARAELLEQDTTLLVLPAEGVTEAPER